MEIHKLQKENEKGWDEYVYKSDSSTFYHQISWKNVIERTYGHKPIYLIAKENGEIKGILPLFLMKSIFFGKKLVSVPFGPYGGVCADNKTVEDLLIDKAIKLTKEYRADYLELRNITKQDSNLIEKSLQVTSILDLDSDYEVIWEKIKRDKKRGIEKARKANLKIIWDLERINDFYDIYVQTMWYLGSPAHNINFFRNIIQEFPDDTHIVIVEHKDKAIGSIFLLIFKDSVISGWSGSNKEYSRFYPNNLAYWEALKFCCEKGYNFFDFGRSMPNSGVHEFKKSFGAETKYLQYQYYLNKISETPNTTTLNPKRQIFANMWRKLPIPIANSIGPILRKSFP